MWFLAHNQNKKIDKKTVKKMSKKIKKLENITKSYIIKLG